MGFPHYTLGYGLRLVPHSYAEYTFCSGTGLIGAPRLFMGRCSKDGVAHNVKYPVVLHYSSVDKH